MILIKILGSLLLCIICMHVGSRLGFMMRGESPVILLIKELREKRDKEYNKYLLELDKIDAQLIHADTEEAKENNLRCFERRMKRMKDYSLYLDEHDKKLQILEKKIKV